MSAQSRGEPGRFRSTLALIFSIIALALSYMAYSSSQEENDLSKSMKELQTKVEGLKQESSKQIDKLRGETANALEQLSEKVGRKNPKK